MVTKEEVINVLKRPEVISNHGMEFDEIKDHFNCSESELNMIIKESKRNGSIVAISFRRAGRWYLKYYSPPYNETPIHDRIEEIFIELAIPPWVKTRVFRGAEVIFVGEYGKKPGFIIIDYSENPPLIFHDRFAGGKANEIVDQCSRSKYKCEKDDRIIWYSYIGKKS